MKPGARLRNLVGETRYRDTVRLEDVTLQARDRKRFDIEMICNRYLMAEECVFKCNIRGVTEGRQAEDELRRSNEDLQQFAYAASHWWMTRPEVSGRDYIERAADGAVD